MNKKCRNWKGLNFKDRKCKVGIEYESPVKVCLGKGGKCEKYETYTKKELKKQDEDMKKTIDLVVKGLSPCCGAEVDHSHQIPDGRHKGHGPHYCSKCRKLAYYV